MCSSTQLSCGLQLWPSTTQSSVHTHSDPRRGIRPLHRKFQNLSTSQRSRFHPNKTRQGNGTPRLQLSHSVQLRSRVVGDQDENHVLIRVRHRSRTSPWVSLSQCVAHGNTEFLQTILGLVLRLVGIILISVLLCLAILCVFDVTLNSSMAFSSLFVVVQSSEPHCPQCLALGSSDDFFCVTASSPISVADFSFTYSCNPPMYPSSVVPCHTAPPRAAHLTRLPLLDMNSRRL